MRIRDTLIKRCFWFVVTVFAVLSLAPASAQQFSLIGNGKFARIEGALKVGSHSKFIEFLNQNPRLVGLQLSSPGGVVVTAVEMANEIAARNLSTYIGPQDYCASACALLFFAGHDRLVRGRLGVHQMDDGGRGTASSIQFVLAKQLDAFQRFGVPWPVTHRMLTTPPEEMYWFSVSEIEDFGLNRDLAGDRKGLSTAKVAADPQTVARTILFADFPPSVTLTASASFPNFSGRDKAFRQYRTRIRNGVNDGVNFAGHYAFVTIGCGTSCKFAFVVDLRDGTVFDFPYGGEDQYQMDMLFSPDSRLLKVRWKENWSSENCIEKDMVVVGTGWQIVAERTIPSVDDLCFYPG